MATFGARAEGCLNPPRLSRIFPSSGTMMMPPRSRGGKIRKKVQNLHHLVRLFDRTYFRIIVQPPASEDDASCPRSEEHTSELQSLTNLVCRLLLEKKKNSVLYFKHSINPRPQIPAVI